MATDLESANARVARPSARGRRVWLWGGLAGVVIVAASGWALARAALDDVAPEEPPGPNDMPVAVPTSGETVPGPLETICVDPVAWTSTDTHPLLAAATITHGAVESCVDVYRISDLDPSKDYFRAVISSWWTTESTRTAWPWQTQGEPAGEVWLELAWGHPVLDMSWQTQWMQYGECRGSDDERIDADIRAFEASEATTPRAVCEQWPTTIGQPGAELDSTTFSVVSLANRDATTMTVDIGIADGEVPDFTLDIRQVDIEG